MIRLFVSEVDIICLLVWYFIACEKLYSDEDTDEKGEQTRISEGNEGLHSGFPYTAWPPTVATAELAWFWGLLDVCGLRMGTGGDRTGKVCLNSCGAF